jgi:streptogramin lyase
MPARKILLRRSPARILPLFSAAGLLLGAASGLSAQTDATTVASGSTRTVDNQRAVSGVRIRTMPDGTVWFLVPSNDRIVQLQADGKTFKQWQIRQDKDLGANPVDFQIDGNFVWFIENGESLIDAGFSAIGRLDTTTGQLREWVLPGSKPAGFWRAPDGNMIWIPQTNGRLQSLDLTTLQVVDYHSSSLDSKTFTFAYSDVTPGPDGALWLTDFGNNRIVRYVPGALTETSWTFLDPNQGRLNPSQIAFDDQGMLWITQFSGRRIDRFNPATSELASFVGFTSPVHFDIFNGRIYVAEATGSNGLVTVLDPALAIPSVTTLTPQTLGTKSLVNQIATTTRDSTITPTNYTSTLATFAATDLTVTAPTVGILTTTIPDTNAYGISAQDGGVWVGSNGFLVRLTLQSIGEAADLTVPFAAEYGVSPGERITADLTLYNRGSSAISGDALFLHSPGSFAPRATFSVDPGATVFLPDVFQAVSSNAHLTFGPIRLRVTTGTATDLVASVRTERVLDDGSSLGFSFPGEAQADVMGTGMTRTLFTDARPQTTAVLGLYAPAAASASLTLVAPDGTVRGTRLVTLDTNVSQEFNPLASAFGASSEPGDVVRVSVLSGSLQPYVNVLDSGTSDVAPSVPVATSTEALIPNLGVVPESNGTSYVSDLLLSNPDPATAANVTLSYAPLGGSGSPSLSNLTLGPNQTRVLTDVVPGLFGVTSGQGALGVVSSIPVAVTTRVAARRAGGDYGTFAPAFDVAESIPDGGAAAAIGVPQTATRRTSLLLYNHGSAGTATVIGYDGKGTEVGRIAVPIGSRQPARVSSVFLQLGVFDQDAGRLRIETTPGMKVYGETAEVDASGDMEIAKLVPAS